MTRQLGLTRGSLVRKVEELDFQFALFEKAGMAATMAERNKFVLKDEVIEAAERGVDMDLMSLSNYKLVKLEKPISIFEVDGNIRSVQQSTIGYAERCGLNAPPKGKYGDEARLIANGQALSQSVEVGEVDAWATM